MTSQHTIYSFGPYYTNFDRDKLFPEKSPVLLITNQKSVELISNVSYVQGE